MHPHTLDLLDTLESVVQGTEGAGLAATLHLLCREILFHFLDQQLQLSIITLVPTKQLAADEYKKNAQKHILERRAFLR